MPRPAGRVGGHPSEFFRGAHFLEAEGATHTLRIETDDAELLAPLIVRPIGDGPDLDAVSPYGYPGFTVNGRGVRRRIAEGANPGGGGSIPSRLLPHRARLGLHPPPARPGAARRVDRAQRRADRRPGAEAEVRPSDRRQVRRNLEAGLRGRADPRRRHERRPARRLPRPLRADDAPHRRRPALLLRRRLLRPPASPPTAPGSPSPPTPTAPRPPPRSPASPTATSTTTSPAAPTRASATRR